MTPNTLTDALKQEAARLGFDSAAATPAVEPRGIARFEQWLADGFAGTMHYLADQAAPRRHPRHVLDGVRSVLMLATNYRTVEPVETGPGEGSVSRYAWGSDYHDVIHKRLGRLADFHRRIVPEGKVRGVVDTAPLLEREFATRAGLGWIGKNTCLISEQFGSWLFLAALLSSEELQYEGPIEGDRCGSCRACLDACPTGALIAPYRLDARKCLSYVTVELRGSIPAESRDVVDDRLFGCDACQEACPYNQGTPPTSDERFQPTPGMNPVDLAELFSLDEPALRRRFHHTPVWRSKRAGILRNAATVLGNRPDPAGLAALKQGLEDPEPTVRAASARALRRYASEEADDALRRRLAVELDLEVRAEIQQATE